jgi:hypothetical protein
MEAEISVQEFSDGIAVVSLVQSVSVLRGFSIAALDPRIGSTAVFSIWSLFHLIAR